MEAFKLGKIIENRVIDIQLALHGLEEARDELRKSLKRRKELAIAENEMIVRRLIPQNCFPMETLKNLMQQ